MSFIYTDYMNRDNPYPANYVYTAAGVLPALGAPFAPDGTNMTNGQTCLFTGLTLAADRGVFRATVVAGNVTAWTRVIYGQSSTGACTDGDIVIVLAGTTYADHQFQCTDTTTATWVDLGLVANLWTRTGTVLSPRTIGDSVAIGTTTSTVDLRIARGAANTTQYIETYNAGGSSSSLTFLKSRNNTIGTLTQTIDTDILGGINFVGVDNTSAIELGASIQVVQDGAAGTSVPANMVLSTSSTTGVNTNQLVLHNDGNVGFGTDAPHSKVHTSSFAVARATKTSGDTGYTLTATDYCILVDTTGGDTTVNLPSAVGCDGRIYVIKKVAAANNMTVGGGGSNIDGDASKTYAANYSSITVISDNTNWHII